MKNIKSTTSKSLKILALIYFIYDIIFAKVVKIFNNLYLSIYGEWWQNNEDVLVKLYHLPWFIWIAIFALISIIIYLLPKKYPKKQKQLTILFSFLLIIIIIFSIYWLGLYLFCHEWGCTNWF